jgi:hypothetical protein
LYDWDCTELTVPHIRAIASIEILLFIPCLPAEILSYRKSYTREGENQEDAMSTVTKGGTLENAYKKKSGMSPTRSDTHFWATCSGESKTVLGNEKGKIMRVGGYGVGGGV